MISQRLIRLVEQNADRLTNDLIASVRRDPRAPAYHKMTDEELHERALDLFQNLGKWLSARTEFAVQTRYEAFGRRRFQEGIPFSQILLVLSTAKNLLIDFIRGSAAADSVAEFPLEYELVNSIGQFYDKALYNAAAGYESAARQAAAPRPRVPVVAAQASPPGSERRSAGREACLDRDDLDLDISRAGDVGESAG